MTGESDWFGFRFLDTHLKTTLLTRSGSRTEFITIFQISKIVCSIVQSFHCPFNHLGFLNFALHGSSFYYFSHVISTLF